MNKTPVSILQEMMIKEQKIPNYELIHDGGGTHINTFVYRVACDGLSATGTGRSKKDAKHEAAKAMLEVIAKHRGYPQLPASPAQSPIRTPVPPVVPPSPRIPPNVPFLNAVGALQDVCSKNNLEDPEYVPISDVGPPHARVFTIQCIVATFKEEGIATTKKQAKHEAAKKMLDRINDLVGDLDSTDDSFSIALYDESRRKEIIANEIAKARYPTLSKISSKKVDLGLKVSEYHTKFKKIVEDEIRVEIVEKLRSLRLQNQHDHSENYDELANQMLTQLKEQLSTINVEVVDASMDVSDDDHHIAAVQVNTSPLFTEIGIGKTNAEALFNSLLSLTNSLIFFLE